MAGFNPIQQNIDITYTNQGTTQSTLSSTSASSQTIDFSTQQTVTQLDDFDKAVMRSLNLDPNNPQDVETWNNMSQADKTRATENYQRVQEQQVISNNNNNENEHSITLPDNWDKMSVSSKQKFIKNLLGKEIYGEEWDKFNIFQKNNRINDKFEEMVKIFDPNYEKYNSKDKQEALSKFTDALNYVLEHFDSNEEITSQKIFDALVEFNNKSTEEQNVALNTISQKEEAEEELNATYIKAIEEHFGKPISEITTQEKLDYVKALKEQGTAPDGIDKIINKLTKQLGYEGELREYCNGKDLSEITDDEEIDFLQVKINEAISENDTKTAQRLQGKKEKLEYEQRLKAEFNVDDINDISTDNVIEYLTKRVNDKTATDYEKSQLAELGHEHTSYAQETSAEVINRTYKEFERAQNILSKHITSTKGISEDQITYNDILDAIDEMEANGTKIEKGSGLDMIREEARVRKENGRGGDAVKAEKRNDKEPTSRISDLGEGFILDKDGLIDIRKSTNLEKFREGLKRFNNSEEFFAWFKNLSPEEQILVRNMILNPASGFTQEEIEKYGFAKFGSDIQITAITRTREGEETNTSIADSATEYSDNNDWYVQQAAQYYSQEQLLALNNYLTSTNNTDLLKLYNTEIAKRDDYNDLLNLINSSNESGKTEASSSSHGSSYGAETSPASYNNNYTTNPIAQNTQNIQTPAAKSVYEQLISGKVSISQASVAFNKLSPDEKKAVLEALPTSELVKMPVSICAICPEFVPKFVAIHKGVEIIKTVPDAASQAIRCMKKSNDNKVKEQLNVFMIENPALFMKISVESAKKSLSNDGNKLVHSNLQDKETTFRLLGRA